MAIPANRLILAPSRPQVAVVVGALGLWTAVDGYFVVLAAPAIVIFFWSLPVPVFAWLVVVLRKTSVMEVDSTGIRRVVGRRVVARVSIRDIGAVETVHNPTLRLAVLRVRDRKGRVRLSLVSGTRASVDDVQFLHQAIARRARELGIPVSPYVEMPPELQLPLDAVRTAHGRRTPARTLVRPLVRVLVVLLVPLLVVATILPPGEPLAGFVYIVLLWVAFVFFLSPRTARLRRSLVARLRRLRSG